MGDAGIERIDYFLTSHFHRDHVGGLTALAERVDIGRYVDHGDSVERERGPAGRALWEAYLAVADGNRRVSSRETSCRCVGSSSRSSPHTAGASNGRSRLLGPNPFCDQTSPGEADMSENGHSLGYLLSLGAFQFLNLGDLTVDRQHALACPENTLGVVDVLPGAPPWQRRSLRRSPGPSRLAPRSATTDRTRGAAPRDTTWWRVRRYRGHLAVTSCAGHR